MAKLRVFVSSTCYDLGIVRSELRPFIESLGHVPIMSEYSDILFDPSKHTHDSCIKEIPSCDVLVVVIGSRFGGTATPKAIQEIDIDKLNESHPRPLTSEKLETLSITQIEVLKAIESRIPIYVFVDQKVYHDHHLYEANKSDKAIINSITFPSIQKQSTAKYIFEFINFIRSLPINNAIYAFNGLDEIKYNLRNQWSHKFQELLRNATKQDTQRRRFNHFSEQIEDLKNVILVSMQKGELKEVGKGVLRYRRMIDFFGYISIGKTEEAFLADVSFEKFLRVLGIKEIVSHSINYGHNRMPRSRIAVVMDNDDFFTSRIGYSIASSFENDWSSFRALSEPTKKAILESVLDNQDIRRPFGLSKHDGKYKDFEKIREAELLISEESEDDED